MMDIEKLIRRLRNDADAYRNGETLGRAFADQEDVLDNAATALSTLKAENKRLNKIVCSIPTTPDSGRTVSQYDKEMSMCAYLDDLEAENEKLRAELENYRKGHCSEGGCAAEKDRDAVLAELEKVKEKYDAAIEYLREIEWCAGCKHFGGLDGCKKWAMGQCTEKHDLYEFIGPQKED